VQRDVCLHSLRTANNMPVIRKFLLYLYWISEPTTRHPAVHTAELSKLFFQHTTNKSLHQQIAQQTNTTNKSQQTNRIQQTNCNKQIAVTTNTTEQKRGTTARREESVSNTRVYKHFENGFKITT